MPKLFLSYSRKDSAKARRLAEWLEREGHDVWRDDDDIGGGTSFSAEIEKALKDCGAVLVLWSKDSVQSAWVRDEAGVGRDAGKLIPLTLDGIEPPLGFRQFQAIDLSKWRGHGLPTGAERIRSAIERVTAASPRASASNAAASRPRFRTSFHRPVIIAAVIMAVVAVGAVLAWQEWSGEREIAIAVVPSPQSPDRAMAADYANVAAADMAAFLPRRFDRATVTAPDDASGAASGYRMEISTESHGAAVNATLTLSDTGHATLWSHNWSVADASGADLKAAVSAMASKAALCLTDARGGRSRLSQPALGLYLSGCTGLGDTELSNEDFDTIFERITKLAPDFAPGWGYLALSRSWVAEGLKGSSQEAYASALQSAREAISRARSLDPNGALAYDAEYHLISDDSFRALQVLQKGATADPGYGMIQMHLSDELLAVGRMEDSVEAAHRAVELEPGAPYARSQYITALVYSGEFSKARADIAQARKRWPTDPAIDGAEFAYQYRYGDPRIALELMSRSFSGYSDADEEPNREVIAARLDPTPAKIDQAIAALNGRWSRTPQGKNIVLLALGNFGRVDQVYQMLEDPKFQPFVATDALFRPDFKGVRADPRFMQVAAKLGLVRYWQQSGFWPDFCMTERLPYDCKTEAAKFGSQAAAANRPR
jgi:tetratricopeptide (TPR) repeat protein